MLFTSVSFNVPFHDKKEAPQTLLHLLLRIKSTETFCPLKCFLNSTFDPQIRSRLRCTLWDLVTPSGEAFQRSH